MAKQGIAMVYNKTYMILADGDYALAVSEGTFGGAPTSYYDLFRVENGKIAEHWDVNGNHCRQRNLGKRQRQVLILY